MTRDVLEIGTGGVTGAHSEAGGLVRDVGHFSCYCASTETEVDEALCLEVVRRRSAGQKTENHINIQENAVYLGVNVPIVLVAVHDVEEG